jgi:hypothetical protein
MKAINLLTGEERIYSHDEPHMAFAECHASDNNLQTQFAINPKGLVTKIKKSIREGAHGFHMNNWSIPKSTIGAQA